MSEGGPKLLTAVRALADAFATGLDLLAGEPDALDLAAGDLGLILPEGPIPPTLEAARAAAQAAIAPLRAQAEATGDGAAAWAALARALADAAQAARALANGLAAAAGGGAPHVAAMTNAAILAALRQERPALTVVLLALGIVRVRQTRSTEMIDGDEAAWIAVEEWIDWGALGALLSDPVAHLREAHGWGGVEFDPGPVFGQAMELLRPADAEHPPRPGDAFLGEIVRWSVLRDGAGPPGLEVRAVIAAASGVRRTVALSDAVEAEAWLDVSGSALAAFEIRPPFEVRFTAGASASFDGGLTIRRTGAAALSLVDFAALNVAVARPRIALGASAARGGGSAKLRVDGALDGLSIRVGIEEPDGFLAMILPQAGLAFDTDLAASWGFADGLSVAGGGLAVDVPLTVDLAAVLRLTSARLALDTGDGALGLWVRLDGDATLGPLVVTVAGIGVALSLSEAGDGRVLADLGGASLRATGLPPTGLGLSLDLGAVRGGGILAIDPEAERYAGALALAAEAVNLSAFGVILTKMPDGGDGFSMLAFVRGEFAPIQLGFGFTLNAVGGLLGIHRDLDAEALFAAVRAGRAGDLLAPEDPIRDAPTLIAHAETIFPPRRGRHVFGPTLQVGWGAPRSLITLDLALALTMPEPLRILLIGRVRAVLPDETVKLVALNLDVAGILDLSRGTFDLEGRLFDSVVQAIPITGGFAMKTAWGSGRSFIFSVGGLHPRFAPPTGFPVLPRAGVDLSRSAAFTLRLSAYFAVSSNSLQLGAAVDLLAKLGKFKLEAHLGFDALLIFDPFELDAELRASARISRSGRTLMRLALKARLRGPGPWRINGSVTFEIFWVDVTLRVSKSFGTSAPRDSPRVALVPIFEAALKAPANWASDGTGPLILARGAAGLVPGRALVFSQRDLPLDLDLEQYGGLEIADCRRFEITGVEMGGRSANGDAVAPREAFAIGSVLKLSENDRLVAPDFQDLPSGIGVEGAGIVDDGTQAEAPAGRRVLQIDARSGENPPSPYSEQDEWRPPAVTLARAEADRAAVVIRPERWMAGPVDATTAGPFDSWAEARAASPDGTVSRWHEGRAA